MMQRPFESRVRQALKDVRRLRIRHLRLGPRTLFKIFIYRFRNEQNLDSPSVLEFPTELSWSHRKITITVGITAFNQEALELKRAILSVLNQHRPPDQIILYDDGSTNSTTKKTLQEIADMNKKIHFAAYFLF